MTHCQCIELGFSALVIKIHNDWNLAPDCWTLAFIIADIPCPWKVVNALHCKGCPFTYPSMCSASLRIRGSPPFTSVYSLVVHGENHPIFCLICNGTQKYYSFHPSLSKILYWTKVLIWAVDEFAFAVSSLQESQVLLIPIQI